MDDATIEATPAPLWAISLRLLRFGPDRVEQILTSAECSEISLSGLFHARRGGDFVGAAWGQIIPGRTAFCWPARVDNGEPALTATQLQRTVDQYLDATGVTITQAVLDRSDAQNFARLTQAGYAHLADLDYLICCYERFPKKQPSTDLHFEPFKSLNESRMTELIDQTYGGSLDCSALDGVRPMADVLEGYRATGVFRPGWWFFIRRENRDIGCVLLADHPLHDQAELMYLGIIPEARGRGWGFQATRHAQWLTRNVSRKQMVLAVDDANWPARKIYQQAGFNIWDRRSVCVRRAEN